MPLDKSRVGIVAAGQHFPQEPMLLPELYEMTDQRWGQCSGLCLPSGLCVAQGGPAGLGCSDSSVHELTYKHGLYHTGMWSQGLGWKGGPGWRSSKEPWLCHLPTVALDLSYYWHGPLTFLLQNENIGSEGFQEVLLLFGSAICDSG